MRAWGCGRRGPALQPDRLRRRRSLAERDAPSLHGGGHGLVRRAPARRRRLPGSGRPPGAERDAPLIDHLAGFDPGRRPDQPVPQPARRGRHRARGRQALGCVPPLALPFPHADLDP
ncbi:MAG: hypothetical protein MZU95_04765 [Desulfomicrobium escambiense]|nr:hypothetical protein [Desulfomicrobium escambiense]